MFCRGTENFKIYVSVDKVSWELVVEATLPNVIGVPCEGNLLEFTIQRWSQN